MPTISLTDSSSLTVNATVPDTSVIGKTPHSVLTFLHNDVLGALNQTLDQVQINSLAFGFNYAPELTFAGGSATFTGGAGGGGEFHLHKPTDSLFPSDQFGNAVGTNGSYYFALSFRLSASATATGSTGAFCLTLAAKASATAALYLPFPKSSAGAFPTLQSGLETLLGSYKLPTKIDDIKAWPTGTVFTFDCLGSVSFKTSINMLAAINPTASPSFSSTAGPITVTAGPSVTVTGSFTLSGEYEVRLWKRDANTLQLGYYKKAATTLSVGFDGSLGADAAVGSFDLIAKLYGLLGDNAQLDPDFIKNNLPQDQADNVKAVFKAAVAQKLTVEVNGECDTTATDEAAFSWNFDLSAAGSIAQGALTDALQGKLDPLLNGGKLPAGVTAAGSILDRIREKKRTFTLNFLGLYDHATVNDAVVDLQTKTTEDGQLILTDTAHIQRLSADTTPFIKSNKLRQVLVEDGTATVSYAAMFGKVVPQLTVKYLYFDFQSSAKSSDLVTFLDIARTVTGHDASGPWQSILQAKLPSQTAYLNVALNYDVPSASALFLDRTGSPRPMDDYIAVVRNTILSMPRETTLDANFLASVRDNAKWQNLLDAGSLENIYEALGVDRIQPPTWARFAAVWVSDAGQWKPRMHSASQAMLAITDYLQQHPGDDLKSDQAFQELRRGFASHLADSIQHAPVFPDDASGLFILFNAAKPASVSVTINYGGKTVSYP